MDGLGFRSLIGIRSTAISNQEKHIQKLSNSFQDLHNQIQEDKKSIDFVVPKVQYLEHIAGENEDLKSELSFYSPDYEDD
ncbi:MAG: hypothetical protein KA714_22720 [Limnoraphis sp. WC205]|jgi:hypothetical protein|nr:hypothetical protein [Limnoraphis sp. WC205]